MTALAGSEFDRQNTVLMEKIGDEILVVTINRPRKRNAVDEAVTHGLARAVEISDADPKLRVVILTGAAGGGFCAGIDLAAVSRAGTGPMVTETGGFAGFVYARRRLPWIAAVEGGALGGGFELALACEMIVAGRDAIFGQSEVKHGLAAFGGGMFRLPRMVPRQVANEMLLTGDPICADRAFELGLVNCVGENGTALETAMSLARRVCTAAPLSVAETLRVSRLSIDMGNEGLATESRRSRRTLTQSADAQEGINAFLQRRRPVWRGL